jgi:hypothetical protein
MQIFDEILLVLGKSVDLKQAVNNHIILVDHLMIKLTFKNVYVEDNVNKSDFGKEFAFEEVSNDVLSSNAHPVALGSYINKHFFIVSDD